MARPRKDPTEMRTKSVNVALTPAEYSQLQQLAGHGNRVIRPDSKRPMPTRQSSMADIIRNLLFAPTAKRSNTLGDDERKALPQLAGMARNLNQLAARANAQDYSVVSIRLNKLADDIRTIIDSYDRKI